MKLTGSKKNFKRRLLFSISFIFLAAIVVYKIFKYPIVKKKVETVVETKSNGLYAVSYDSIRIDEIAGDLYIKNLRLKPDTGLQLKYIRDKDTNAARVLYNVYIPLVKVINFKTAKALLAKEVESTSILIKDPKVLVWFFPGVGQKKNPQQNVELYKQILGKLKLIKTNSITVENAQVSGKDFFTKETKFQANNASIKLSDVLIDSTYKQDTSRVLFCKQIGIHVVNAKLGEKNIYAELRDLTFNTEDKILHAGKLEYDGLKGNGFFKSELNNLSITGIDWKGPFESSDLSIDKVLMEKAAVEIKNGEVKNKKSNYGKRILTGWIKTFDLKHLQVNDISYKNFSSNAKQRPMIIENNKLSISDVHLESLAKLDESLVNQIKELDINNDKISIISEDRMYTYQFKGFHFNTSKRELAIKEFSISPHLGEVEFADKVYFSKDRYNAQIKNIKASNVDVQQLVTGKISIEKVETSDNSIRIYRDVSRPSSTPPKEGTFPHQILYRLPIPLKIDKLTAYNTYIEYKEKNGLSDTSGTVRFAKASVSIGNINNRLTTRGATTNVNFKALVLGTVPVTANVTFYLDNIEEGKFNVYATMQQKTNLKILNEITAPMALMRIEDGLVDSLSVYLQGNNRTVTGKLTGGYSSLRISMLKKHATGYNKKDLKSVFGNFLVKNGNKNRSKSAPIEYSAETNKSFFYFVWKATVAGMKKAVLLKL